jgi:CheY-like chemotaxis protein
VRATRCLIVDDEPDNADSLAVLLGLLQPKLAVRTVYSAAEALTVAAAFVPDVAVVDLRMPQYDGYWLAGQFRRDPLLQRTVLVAYSGLAKPGDAEEAIARGFDMHIRKPAPPDEFETAIKRARALTDEGGAPQLRATAGPSEPDTAALNPSTGVPSLNP